jgi:very-short-patch-repair endonuclease
MQPSESDRWADIAGWPDGPVSELAARQRTMLEHSQLRDLGASTSAIDRAVRRGRLHTVHHGVYSLVAARARPPLAAEHGALLAGGPTALLSHITAARMHGFQLAAGTDELYLTVVGADRRRPGITIHRTRTLNRTERTRVAGLPVTSVARTVVDLAAGQSDGFVERFVDQALKRTSRAKLNEALQRHPGRPGTPAVRRALAPGRPSGDTWSDREKKLLALVRRGGLPSPEANVPVGRYFPDLLWREYQVIVEYDSTEYHSSEGARIADAVRHNDLTNWGFNVLHVTSTELSRHPERVLVWIAAALARRGWSGAA